MNKEKRIEKLREHLIYSTINHKQKIMKLSTLKDVHIYCVINSISAQQYGPLIERYIQKKYKYKKNNSKYCTGDCNKDGQNVEIKASLGGITHRKFNFVQLRPSHDCDIYILTAYNLSFENVNLEGELYIFKVTKDEIKKLIVLYGGYAHGTIKEHGEINLNIDINKEYVIRPTINDKCWNSLLNFRVNENDL